MLLRVLDVRTPYKLLYIDVFERVGHLIVDFRHDLEGDEVHKQVGHVLLLDDDVDADQLGEDAAPKFHQRDQKWVDLALTLENTVVFSVLEQIKGNTDL